MGESYTGPERRQEKRDDASQLTDQKLTHLNRVPKQVDLMGPVVEKDKSAKTAEAWLKKNDPNKQKPANRHENRA